MKVTGLKENEVMSNIFLNMDLYRESDSFSLFSEPIPASLTLIFFCVLISPVCQKISAIVPGMGAGWNTR